MTRVAEPMEIAPPEHARVRLSVLVCTAGRGDKLGDLLDSLIACDVDAALPWEVIAVENNPTESLRGLVEGRQPPGSPRLRYLHEGRRGKGHALDAAIQASRGEILVFTDDDIRADASWIRTILREYEAHPELSGFGGRVELHDARDLPISIRTSRERIDAIDPVLSLRNIPVIGCNFTLRRRVLEELGSYDLAFGPGSAVGCSDDSDMLYRVLRAGHKIAYCPDVLVFHDHGRRTEAHIKGVADRYQRGRGGFYCKWLMRGDAHVARLAARELVDHARAVLDLVRDGRSPGESLRRIWLLWSGAWAYLRTGGRKTEPRVARLETP